MKWKLDADRPIYAQLIDGIMQAIVSGEYKPGEKLPSVRDLAVDAAVNPNTMQKALAELEETGLLHTQRTAGRYITSDKELLQRVKGELAKARIEEFFVNMQSMGFSHEEIVGLINKQEKQQE